MGGLDAGDMLLDADGGGGCQDADCEAERPEGEQDPADECPQDSEKESPGVCGCGVADADTDGDGAADCVDQCPNDPGKDEPGPCGCGVVSCQRYIIDFSDAKRAKYPYVAAVRRALAERSYPNRSAAEGFARATLEAAVLQLEQVADVSSKGGKGRKGLDKALKDAKKLLKHDGAQIVEKLDGALIEVRFAATP